MKDEEFQEAAELYVQMSKNPRVLAEAKFYAHIQLRGISLYYDKRGLTNVVSDIFSGDEELLNVMRIAISFGVSVELAELAKAPLQEIGITRIISNFAKKHGIMKSRAADAVRVLAVGLGMGNISIKT